MGTEGQHIGQKDSMREDLGWQGHWQKGIRPNGWGRGREGGPAVTNPAVGTGCMAGKVKHVVKGQQPWRGSL